MDFKTTLQKLKKEIDTELEKYLTAAIRRIDKQDKETGLALRQAAKIILSGGKRIRPMLMYFGYVGAGGQERKKIIRAAVSIEIIHNFLLVHDDIMDHGQKRHGLDTLNVFYTKKGSSEHFGNSMAIVIGDLLQNLGTQALIEAGFADNLTLRAVNNLENIISTTTVGQIQDICIENKKTVTEKEVLEMYRNKTAKYTLEGPLQMGAILAGAKKDFLDQLSRLAVPIGMAFQIQDDILGLFGADKKTGKKMGGDIKEGKKTLLILRALKKAEKSDRKFLEKNLGNKSITLAEIKKVQGIIKESGALEYCKDLAKELVGEGQKNLSRMRISKEAKDFLWALSEYILAREA